MVKKIKKYLKFVVCCALIMSIIVPSYAALSASDGSAFVTKAEFDSALADFNARLTTFEAGINSKIDSQVTSYLDRNGIWNGQKLSYIKVNGRLFHNKPYEHWTFHVLDDQPYKVYAEGVDPGAYDYMGIYYPGFDISDGKSLVDPIYETSNFFAVTNVLGALNSAAGGGNANRQKILSQYGIPMGSFYPFKTGELHDRWVFAEPVEKTGMLYLKFGFIFESWSLGNQTTNSSMSFIQEFFTTSNMHTWTWAGHPTAFQPGHADYTLIESHENLNFSDAVYVDGSGAYWMGLTTYPEQLYSAMTATIKESVQLYDLPEGAVEDKLLGEHEIGSVTINNNFVNNSNAYFALHPRGVAQFMVFVQKGDTLSLVVNQTCISRINRATGWNDSGADWGHVMLRVEDAAIY